jgi:putative endonuclease
MAWFARLMYRALVWKERQRARATGKVEAVSRGGGQTGPTGATAPHLATGQRGETLAYWYLRQAGYTIVARNQASRSGVGELDLVAWDGPTLAFIEVKTRTSDEAGPPEAAVSLGKQRRIIKTAAEYRRRLKRRDVSYRFDIVSVSWDPAAGYQVRLIKDAFQER